MTLNLKKVRKDLLSEHNKCRSAHGVSGLIHSKTLEAQAQQTAEALSKRNELDHIDSSYKGNPIGENLFRAFHSAKTPDQVAMLAIVSWYGEVDRFDYDKPDESMSKCGHFTQVVWKGTRKVGFGVAKSDQGQVYVVGQFFPSGNFKGLVANNVNKPKNGKRHEFPQDSEPQQPLSPIASVGGGANGPSPAGPQGEPIRKETKQEVKDEEVDGKAVHKTITTEIEHFEDGSMRTTTRTKTETFN